MERSSFIKLLEEYKVKALKALYKESKIQASLLIQHEFRQAILELENVCRNTSAGLNKVSKEVENICNLNALTGRYAYLNFQNPTTEILDTIVGFLDSKIRQATSFEQKRNEINSKFDAAIKSAKATRSVAKLKELADALGIETPSIEVTTNSATQGVDTEFIKEKIKSVLLLE